MIDKPTFIVELGSGNTCRNSTSRIREMIDGISMVDTEKYKVLLKMQLFTKAGDNVPLRPQVFDYAFEYAAGLGYDLSASVFDDEWLKWLLEREPAFIKLACIPELHYLSLAVPESVQVFASFASDPGPLLSNIYPLCCVRKYPAKIEDYDRAFSWGYLSAGISDHTKGFTLMRKYRPFVFEKHVVDVREEGNPDAGPFAATIRDLEGIL